MRVFLLFIIISPLFSIAQNIQGLIENGKYEKAWKKCQKVLKNSPESIEELYFTAVLQSKTLSGEIFNPIEALEYFRKAQGIYREINDQKQLEKLDEIPINLKAFRVLNDSISRGGLIQAKKRNSEEGYINYLANFPMSTEIDRTFAINERNRLAFQQAKNENSENSFQQFIDKYPQSHEVVEAKNLRNQVAFAMASGLNSIESYDTFLNKYPDANERNLAISKRNAIAFEQAKAQNTISAFEQFIQKYPDALEVGMAKNQIIELAYFEAQKLNSIEGYQAFNQKYPNSSHSQEAQEKIHELAFELAKLSFKSDNLQKFINDYPNSKQINEAKLLFDDLQYSEAIDENDWQSYSSFVNNFPKNRNSQKAKDKIRDFVQNTDDPKLFEYLLSSDPYNDSLIEKLYTNFTKDGELSTLMRYKEEYPQYLPSSFENDIQIATIGTNLFLHLPYSDKNKMTYLNYLNLSPNKELSFVVVQRILSPFIKAKQFNQAVQFLDILPIDKKSKKIIELKELLLAKGNPNIIPVAVKTINTQGNEFSPVISTDDKSLFYCGENRQDNLGGEDIFEATKNGKFFSTPFLNELSTESENEAPVGVSSDGTKMILFKSGKLFISEKLKNGWSELEELGDEINNGDWQGDAMLSSDGNFLLYSSFRKGEIQNINTLDDKIYHGDYAYPTDIFLCKKENNGLWSYPINLGNVINTPYCDRFPFLHPDMKTLYFSSDGHGGLGKLDVFVSKRLSDSCWNCWSIPVNLGKEINTIESDAGYKISTSGDVAYFTQNKREIQESSVMFILDVSGSMTGEKIEELKEVSKKTIQDVINNNSEVAIAAFDGSCEQPITYYLPFTQNFVEVELFIDDLNASGGTPMYEAYYQASYLLKANNKNPLKNRVIVLMTDGDANSCIPLNSVMQGLKNAGNLFKTQTIAYGVQENSLAYFDLKGIASFSGGDFFAANSTNDLGAAFEQANNSIFQIISGPDNKDIFEINLPTHLRPDYVAKIEGELKNSKNEPIATTIRWEDLEADQVIGIAKTDPRDGSYFIALPLGKNYGYFVEDTSYFPISNNLDLRNISSQIEVNNDIKVITFDEMINQGIAVSMNNLFFDFGKYDLLPPSFPELKRIAKIINHYHLKVGIHGHTDNVGDENSNLLLSNKRAMAVKDYLVSLGCNGELLITKGFGETLPTNPNDTEENRSKNRRVELQLIK